MRIAVCWAVLMVAASWALAQDHEGEEHHHAGEAGVEQHHDGGHDEHVSTVGEIEIIHAWSRATDGDEAVLFMQIVNEGSEEDVLVGATSPIAARIELHGAVLEGGEEGSQAVGEMSIPAGGELELEPGALFFKLFGLEQELHQGEDYVAEVSFQHAGTAEVHVQIEGADAKQHSHAGHAH